MSTVGFEQWPVVQRFHDDASACPPSLADSAHSLPARLQVRRGGPDHRMWSRFVLNLDCGDGEVFDGQGTRSGGLELSFLLLELAILVS